MGDLPIYTLDYEIDLHRRAHEYSIRMDELIKIYHVWKNRLTEERCSRKRAIINTSVMHANFDMLDHLHSNGRLRNEYVTWESRKEVAVQRRPV
jgi:hypothetical protein